MNLPATLSVCAVLGVVLLGSAKRARAPSGGNQLNGEPPAWWDKSNGAVNTLLVVRFNYLSAKQ